MNTNDIIGMDSRVIKFHHRRGDIKEEVITLYTESLDDDAEHASESEVRFESPAANRTNKSSD